MKSKLYEYAIVWHPNKKEIEEGLKSVLLVEPRYVLATDRRSAIVSASMDIPSVYKDTLDQVEILLRPFLDETCVTSRTLGISGSTNGNFYVDTFTNQYTSVDYNIIKKDTSNE